MAQRRHLGGNITPYYDVLAVARGASAAFRKIFRLLRGAFVFGEDCFKAKIINILKITLSDKSIRRVCQTCLLEPRRDLIPRGSNWVIRWTFKWMFTLGNCTEQIAVHQVHTVDVPVVQSASSLDQVSCELLRPLGVCLCESSTWSLRRTLNNEIHKKNTTASDSNKSIELNLSYSPTIEHRRLV